jgi:hypothetical protein
MKSSLKTFLAGKNGKDIYRSVLKDAKQLHNVCKEEAQDFNDPITGRLWAIDVLDDGTAITYQAGE